MKNCRVFFKVYLCNNFLRRFCKSGKGEIFRKIFKDMILVGIVLLVFIYNIMIDDRCKERDMVGVM